MDGQYWKGDRTMSTNEWLLTSDFWQFLEPWHGRWYENEIFIASCTDNIYDLQNERWLLGDMIGHVGIYGSRVAEGLSAFNVGLVNLDIAWFSIGICTQWVINRHNCLESYFNYWIHTPHGMHYYTFSLPPLLFGFRRKFEAMYIGHVIGVQIYEC